VTDDTLYVLTRLPLNLLAIAFVPLPAARVPLSVDSDYAGLVMVTKKELIVLRPFFP